jgi:peptide/nickel transport system ATP-binding protein
MYSGVIVEIAKIEGFFSDMRHPYTHGLLGAIPRIRERRKTLDVISGQIPNLIDPPSGCRYHPRCPLVKGRCKRERPQLIEIAPRHHVACFKVQE